MAILKIKDIRAMKKEEKNKKLNELKLELIKSKFKNAQGSSSKTREIKKAIARLLTK